MGSLYAEAYASSVRIAVPPISNLLEEGGSGIYQHLFRQASASLDIDVQSVFYPYRRAVRSFDARDVDCIFSFGDVLLQTYSSDDLVSSFPLGKFSFHAFTEKDKPVISTIDEMISRQLAGIMGHELYLERVLDGSTPTDMVMSEYQAVQMLKQGRVEVVIAALPDIQPYVDDLNYDPEFPLFIGFDRLNCHNTELNRGFIQDLSQQLIKMKNEGVYERVGGEYYVPF